MNFTLADEQLHLQETLGEYTNLHSSELSHGSIQKMNIYYTFKNLAVTSIHCVYYLLRLCLAILSHL